MSDNEKNFTMDKDAASKTLHNILEACDQPTSTVANTEEVEHLVHEEMQVTTYNTAVTICIAAIILTLLFPLAFIPFSTPLHAIKESTAINVIQHEIRDGKFAITVGGDMIDYTSPYAINSDNDIIYPISYEAATGTIVFPYDEKEWNIYISDYNGQKLHLLLSPRE